MEERERKEKSLSRQKIRKSSLQLQPSQGATTSIGMPSGISATAPHVPRQSGNLIEFCIWKEWVGRGWGSECSDKQTMQQFVVERKKNTNCNWRNMPTTSCPCRSAFSLAASYQFPFLPIVLAAAAPTLRCCTYNNAVPYAKFNLPPKLQNKRRRAGGEVCSRRSRGAKPQK